MAKTRYFYASSGNLLPFFPLLDLQLRQARIESTAQEYLSDTLDFTIKNFLFLSATIFLVLLIAGRLSLFLTFFIGIAIFTFMLFTRRMAYPKFMAGKIIKDIDNNLLPVIRTIIIQVESGVPLFTTIVAVSNENYGEISKAFKKAVREINAGKPEVDALEEIANESPSVFFRRSIWQITNGIKGGSEISIVLREIARNISEEQLDQIGEYGSALNPLAMFYMIIAIIMPTLAITFFVVFSSFIGLEAFVVQAVLWVFYTLIILMQIVFLGIIKSRRPSLLRD